MSMNATTFRARPRGVSSEAVALFQKLEAEGAQLAIVDGELRVELPRLTYSLLTGFRRYRGELKKLIEAQTEGRVN